MSSIDIKDFSAERECVYEGERYTVRNNGSVLRHHRVGKRARSQDDEWTFGRANSSNPYLYIASVRVHRIVATAFHGNPPDSKYVVDHIDSNCRNNRPENLRWLTRLENTLLNPVTRKKIEYLCGSIEAFLENPSILNDMSLDPNVAWMRTVTRDEAENCKTRMTIWANSSTQKRPGGEAGGRGSWGSRALKPIHKWEAGLAGEPGLGFALTSMCGQYMWKYSAYFPCCPTGIQSHSIDSYFLNLKNGDIFCFGDDKDIGPPLAILEFAKTMNQLSIVVLCTVANQLPESFAIAGVSLNEKGYFIHFGLGSYGDKVSAMTAFQRRQELVDFWSAGYNNF